MNVVKHDHAFTDSNGVRYPRNYPKDEIEELTEVVVNPPTIPNGQRIASENVQLVNDVPTMVYVLETIPADELAASLVAVALAQEERIYTPITMALSQGTKTFTPTDKHSNRVGNLHATMTVANVATSNFVFDDGTQAVTLADLEAMATATYNQWQPYFDNIESEIAKCMNGTYTTEAQVINAFDAILP